jgi:hypothetical protein
MNTIGRFISGVLSAVIAFFLGLFSSVPSSLRKAFTPTRTIYTTRQQRRHMARVKANDYARVLRHLPRKWRRRAANNMAKMLYPQMPRVMTVEV